MAMKLDFNDRNRDSLIDSYLDALSDKLDDTFNAVAVESPCEWDVKEIGCAEDAKCNT